MCHSGHTLVELWTKRGYSCDCGTKRIGGKPCQLRQVGELEDSDNSHFGQNFDGVFCHCHESSFVEDCGVMFQCLLGVSCEEDWYHPRCILGLSKSDLENRKHTHTNDTRLKIEESSSSDEDEDDDDDTELLYPEIPLDHEAFICWKCVASSGLDDLLADDPIAQQVEHGGESSRGSVASENDGTDREAKRPRKIKEISIFLKKGYRRHIKELPKMASCVQKYPFLIEKEEAYQPPRDEDAEFSIKDCGEKALLSLPYEQAFGSIDAYHKLEEKLKLHLSRFAQQGKDVTADDIHEIFSRIKADEAKQMS